MEDIKTRIQKEQLLTNRKKAIMPNLSRLVANLIVLTFVSDEAYFFKSIIFAIIIYSFLWLSLEFLIGFNYEKFKILPYFPATSDLISSFIIIYLTGCGNSAFSGMLVSLVVVSALFSSDTFQSTYILLSSLIVYFLLLLGLYYEVYPYVNLLDFGKTPGFGSYLFSYSIIFTLTITLFLAVRTIGKANVELNSRLKELILTTENEKNRSNKLLLNILPTEVAEELKDNGAVKPVLFKNVSIMFTDFEGFTKIAEKMSPEELIKTLDTSFTQFDKITEKYNLEKLKTIGDSYMCAGGLPIENKSHPLDTCLAALEMKSFMDRVKELQTELGLPHWDLRIGIHCGSVIAGVIGEKKFTYDIWGDAVNTASRLESSGVAGQINISQSVFERVHPFFICEYRGKIPAKNKGDFDMYFLKRILPEFSLDEDGTIPNERFWEESRKQ